MTLFYTHFYPSSRAQRHADRIHEALGSVWFSTVVVISEPLEFSCAGDSCHLLAGPRRSTVAHLCDVNNPEKASEVVPLLAALRHCPLEELHMPGCLAADWAQFRGAEWINLKIADFRSCRGLVWLQVCRTAELSLILSCRDFLILFWRKKLVSNEARQV